MVRNWDYLTVKSYNLWRRGLLGSNRAHLADWLLQVNDSKLSTNQLQAQREATDSCSCGAAGRELKTHSLVTLAHQLSLGQIKVTCKVIGDNRAANSSR
ncbi:hypothetical protein CesoFtcFv8_020492 [Champsocephalus esox]|uniref:Uncharacterized protein n=1 Tax=Champsocephalus esox TaxID=159716 RepID=A0AAN8BBU4_9TELE|nr:hypothetical protein CesoFtcFv8_020492 [Champsocephalus esox]